MAKKYTALYWGLPLVLFIFQLLFTLNSLSQIRYEELANAIRNPFWLSQGRVYDGVSAAVGWDGIMLLLYNLLGFNLFTGKFFRLFLSFMSLFCLALILKKYLGIKGAWLPLLVIGLSPTLLFYTTLQAQYGIDLQYLPIVIYLLTSLRWWINLIGASLSMIAWLSYSPFIFYLPLLLWLYIKNNRGVKKISLALIAFLAPLFISYLYISNKETFLNDPNTGSGVFRGAGSFSLEAVAANLGGLFNDLFNKGQSYHFDLYWGEFSLIFPIITLAFVFIMSFRLLKYKQNLRSNDLKSYNRYKYYIWLVLASLSATLVLSSLTLDPSGSPGMRRYTPVLAAFYALFVIAWHYIDNLKLKIENLKLLGMGVLSLLLIHHLIVYPINLSHLSDPSPEAYPIWFTHAPSGAGFNSAETPAKSLQNLLDTVQKEDLKLVCLDEKGTPFYCRLSEVYAAVAGSCRWNKLDCHQILGWDHRTGQLIPLNVDLWNSYYFEH